MSLPRPIRPLAAPLRALGLLLVLAAEPGMAQEAAPEAAPEPAAKPAAKPGTVPKPRPRKTAPVKPAAPVAPGPASARAPWPEGAGSVSETYGDWTVNCTRADGVANCSLLQAQGSKRDDKRQFAVELRTPGPERTEGLVLMPFGFSIEPGVTFKLDDAVLGKGAPFHSCTPEGCLVPIALPTLATDAMRTARTLLVLATKPDAKQPTAVTVSLAGFGPALARASALSH